MVWMGTIHAERERDRQNIGDGFNLMPVEIS